MRSRWKWVVAGPIAVAALLAAYHLDKQRRARQWGQRRQELLAAADRAKSLLDGLEAYREEHGEYPKSLEQLVPQRIAQIPRPKLPFSARWEYLRLSGGTEYELFVAVPHGYDPQVRGWVHFTDYFVYRSDRAYPPEDHGGVLERIGDWGYYHE